MEFFGYDTCDKLIWKSGEVSININKIIKQIISKSHDNKISNSYIFGFGCSPYKKNCDILSEDLVLCIFRAYS